MLIAKPLALLSALTAASVPLAGQVAPDAATGVDDDTIVLSPFVVDSTEDRGTYQATATLAGSRIRTELKDVGSAISVVTSQFLQDTGATDNETLLQYTTGTEVGGVYGNFGGMGNTQTLDDTQQRMAPHETTRVRGLGSADNTRDFFLTDIPWDSFNVGRVDLQRGPNAILFGMGKPAGIINHSTNAASFRQSGTVEFRFDNFGSARGSLDYNHVAIEDELAIRVSGLYDDTKYRQKPAFERDERLYAALRYDPEFLRFEGARTSLNVRYETGTITANRPRILPPNDLITPWWTNPGLAALREAGGMNPLTLGLSHGPTIDALRAAGDLGAGVRGDNSNYYNKAIGSFGRNYGGIVAVFDDPHSSDHQLMLTELSKNVTSVVTALPWTIMSGVIPRKDLEGTLQTAENYDFYNNETLKDRSIFDFYENLLDGPNKREWSDHEAFNASLSQTFFNNQLGFEAVVDRQNYHRGQVNLLSEFGQAITIDMNNHLVDGSPNPNYGRAATISDQYANNAYWSDRDSERLTAFADLDFEDYMEDGFLSKLLGRHVFTGLLSEEEVNIERRNWFRYAADATYGLELIDSRLLRDRTVNTLNYISGNIAGRGSLSGAGIDRIRAQQVPSSGPLNVFDMTWQNAGVSPSDPWTNPYGDVVTQAANPANYVGWAGADRGIGLISDVAGDRNKLTTGASLERTVTSSYAGNWQAYLWDGVVVPSFGVRIDEQKAYSLSAGQLPKMADGSDTVDFTSTDYRLPDEPDNIEKGRNESWSLVVHTPRQIREKLWGRTGISLFYNESSNFQPAAGRIDILGNSLPSPKGETEDYGIVISTLDDRLTLKINKYETRVTDSALQGFGGTYMIWGGEGWAYNFARGNLLRTRVGGWADFSTGYDPLGIVADETPAAGWTPEQVAYAQQVGDAITNAYMATRPSDEFFQLWGLNLAAADRGEFIAGSEPAGLTITGDTVSEGTEYELTAQPTPNWNISINAAKTEAQRTNMAGSLIDFVEERWEVYNTPVMLNGQQVGVIGDVRFWNGSYSPGESLRGKFGREFMSGYYLYRIQEDANVPELRPWRFNVVTNYNFDEGVLKGFNVGGAYRWQDEVIIGYPVLPGASVDDPRAFDLDNPYMGSAEDSIDLWVGYQRKLTDRINWRVQLNVRNIFGDDDLIPVTVQPDGSVAAARIPEPTVWTLTNTFSF